MDDVKTGRCLCGACTFILTGPSNWVGHCHCESCRRATASAFTTWIGHPNGAWELSGELRTYQSSPKVERGFCGTCGSPLYYNSTAYPEERHFYASLLNDPNSVTPTDVYFTEEKLDWIELPKDLHPAQLKS